MYVNIDNVSLPCYIVANPMQEQILKCTETISPLCNDFNIRYDFDCCHGIGETITHLDI